MVSKLDLTGHKYGKLLVLSEDEGRLYPSGDRHRTWRCICSCPNETVVVVLQPHLRSGHTQSCGCINREISSNIHSKHGMHGTRIYGVWQAMKARCLNENTYSYKHYGARGITVCKDWVESFEAFYRDMGDGYKEGLQIDRIDNNRGYSKDNCRWVTNSENQRNKRKRLGSSSIYKGVAATPRSDSKPYVAYINYGGRRYHIGHYLTEVEAALAYNEEAVKHEETKDYLNDICE